MPRRRRARLLGASVRRAGPARRRRRRRPDQHRRAACPGRDQRDPLHPHRSAASRQRIEHLQRPAATGGQLQRGADPPGVGGQHAPPRRQAGRPEAGAAEQLRSRPARPGTTSRLGLPQLRGVLDRREHPAGVPGRRPASSARDVAARRRRPAASVPAPCSDRLGSCAVRPTNRSRATSSAAAPRRPRRQPGRPAATPGCPGQPHAQLHVPRVVAAGVAPGRGRQHGPQLGERSGRASRGQAVASVPSRNGGSSAGSPAIRCSCSSTLAISNQPASSRSIAHPAAAASRPAPAGSTAG